MPFASTTVPWIDSALAGRGRDSATGDGYRLEVVNKILDDRAGVLLSLARLAALTASIATIVCMAERSSARRRAGASLVAIGVVHCEAFQRAKAIASEMHEVVVCASALDCLRDRRA